MNETANRSHRILLIEDEPQIRKFLRISLESNGFLVLESRLGADGLARCAGERPDLVILDLGLPDMDGLDVIPALREWSKVPVIVLSVRSDEREKVAALDAGANDYVTKPFGISELMARIRALLRVRQNQRELAVFQSQDLQVDLATREVRLAGTPVRLTRKEYTLLRLLVTHPGQVLTHRQILEEIWGATHADDTHYLRVLVGHLRGKLKDQPTNPRYIVTEPGIGYRFVEYR
jgi:two-component system, OmpR family, KDP operon response regulator KdpE